MEVIAYNRKYPHPILKGADIIHPICIMLEKNINVMRALVPTTHAADTITLIIAKIIRVDLDVKIMIIKIGGIFCHVRNTKV